jgi:hypothetical protein
MKKPDPVIRAVRMDAGQLRLSDGTERGEALARRLLAGAYRHLDDGAYWLTLEPIEETRRGRANRWLFGPVYTLILTEMIGRKPTKGEKAIFHEQMKLRHNPIEVTDPFTGEVQTIGGPTHTMTVEQFCAFTESVMLDGAEAFGISYPEPRESEDYREKGRRAA